MKSSQIFPRFLILTVFIFLTGNCSNKHEELSPVAPPGPETRISVSNPSLGANLGLSWVSFDNKPINSTKMKYITTSGTPELTAMIHGTSISDDTELEIRAWVDGVDVDFNVDFSTDQISFTPPWEMKPGNHAAGCALKYPGTLARKHINFYFTVNPNPPVMTAILRNDPTNTLYAFFSERLDPEWALNPANRGLNAIGMNVAVAIDLINGGLTARIQLKQDIPFVLDIPGYVELQYNSERGLSSRKIRDGVKPDRSGDGSGDCTCGAVYKELKKWDFGERENNALAFRIDVNPGPEGLCPTRFYWNCIEVKDIANISPKSSVGECTRESFTVPEDSSCDSDASGYDGHQQVTESFIDTLIFTRNQTYKVILELRADCDEDNNYEKELMTPIEYFFTPLDCVNPEITDSFIGTGAEVAFQFQALVDNDDWAGHRPIYEDYPGCWEGFQADLSLLAAADPCDRFALMRVTDNHTLHPDEAAYIETYSDPMPMPCGLGTLPEYTALRVDLSPHASYDSSGEHFVGQEFIDWPDPVLDGRLPIDDEKVNEVEYFVVQINDFMDADFMQVRWEDTFGNWKRTARLWDKYSDSYSLEWVPGTFITLGGDHEQYVNWEKHPDEICDPNNYGTRICLNLKVEPNPLESEMLYVRLRYFDIPLQPMPPLNRGPAPWLDPPPPPANGDNQGSGAGFAYTAYGPEYLEIAVPVPCDGNVEAFFFTSSFGGDNYLLKALLYAGDPFNGGELLDHTPPIFSPPIEVWRKLRIALCSMERPWWLTNNPADFYPPHNMSGTPFLEGYIRLEFYYLHQDMEFSSTLVTGTIGSYSNAGSDMEYVDDFPPEDDTEQNPEHICGYPSYPYEEFFNQDFHDTEIQCRTPAHAIQATGIDAYTNPSLLGKTPGHPNDLDSHHHVFVALGRIWRDYGSEDYEKQVVKTLVHELGHQIKGLPHGPVDTEVPYHVMLTSFGRLTEDFHPLHFDSSHLFLLRKGDTCDELPFSCPIC